MVKIPQSTRDSVEYRLAARARERWPDLTRIDTRFRANGIEQVVAELATRAESEACGTREGSSASGTVSIPA